jgi:hypothetical protein
VVVGSIVVDEGDDLHVDEDRRVDQRRHLDRRGGRSGVADARLPRRSRF